MTPDRTDPARRVEEKLSAHELLTRGGEWLGAVRGWIQRKCRNGERVTWGSRDVLERDFSVADVEEIAAIAAAAAMAPQPDEKRLSELLRVRWKAEQERDAALARAAKAEAERDEAAASRDEHVTLWWEERDKATHAEQRLAASDAVVAAARTIPPCECGVDERGDIFQCQLCAMNDREWHDAMRPFVRGLRAALAAFDAAGKGGNGG